VLSLLNSIGFVLPVISQNANIAYFRYLISFEAASEQFAKLTFSA